MRIFKKSLSNELISTAGGLFLILMGIVIAQRAGYLVRSAAKGWIPNDAITTLLGFNMVKFLPMILSLTIFLSVLMTLTRWHRDSEMAVWFSSGLSVSNWIRPILNFAAPVTVVIFLLSFFVMPWATQKVEDYRVQLKSRDDLASISPGVFKESNGGERIYFIEGFDQLGNVVKNIFVHTTQHQKTGVVVSSTGHRDKVENGDNFIVLEKGRRYEGKPNSAEVSTTEFERYALRIETKEVARKPSSTDTLSTEQLLSSELPADQAELQWRLAIPISALILVLLAVPLSFVDPRAGRSLNLMFALLIYIIYNNILSIFQAWVTQGRLSSLVGLWPVHVFFLLLAFYMYYRRTYLLPIIPAFFSYFWPGNWLKAQPKT
ncbi:LPS export ABC transporter permease LptF [Methylotenera versatilis]|uniref:LPS export ABC transporter permease LptF n=1 Tax=Methylotenera versatilis TaxID=1055487 RepID=UPI000645A04F|nr:LPS export ABC transporter permease LptF [Methylotenera versatilis]